MPGTDADDVPTLREVSRTLRDFRDEFRIQMGMMVRKDVHAVEHEALLTRLSRLEADRETEKKEQGANRNRFYFAILGAGLSLLTSIILVAVK